MNDNPADSLRRELREAADKFTRDYYGLSPNGRASEVTHMTLDAIWSLIAAGLEAARADERERIAQAVQRQRDDRRVRWPSAADGSVDYGLGVALHTIFALGGGV